GFSFHTMMSMRSPDSSFETACTREPRMPTQAPTGSMRWSFDFTAILARWPGSRAAPMISMRPWPISGTSMVNSSSRKRRTARLGTDFLEVGAHAITGAHRLARNHFLPGNERFRVPAEINEHIAALDALDDAGDEFTLAVLVLLHHLRALGLAHLLHDDLL